MKCIVQNISAGILNLPEMQLQKHEKKMVEFTERIRYYIAAGYVKLIELYADVEAPSQIQHEDKKSNKKNKFK